MEKGHFIVEWVGWYLGRERCFPVDLSAVLAS